MASGCVQGLGRSTTYLPRNPPADEPHEVRHSARANRCVCVPAPGTRAPRLGRLASSSAIVGAGADPAQLGGGSITDGAKAVQLCLANDITSAEAIDGSAR